MAPAVVNRQHMDLEEDATGLVVQRINRPTPDHDALFQSTYPDRRFPFEGSQNEYLIEARNNGGVLVGFFIAKQSVDRRIIEIPVLCKSPLLGHTEMLKALLRTLLTEIQPLQAQAPAAAGAGPAQQMVRLYVDPRNTRAGTEYSRMMYYTTLGFRLRSGIQIRTIIQQPSANPLQAPPPPAVFRVVSHDADPFRVRVVPSTQADDANPVDLYIGSIRSAGVAIEMIGVVPTIQASLDVATAFPHRAQLAPIPNVTLYDNAFPSTAFVVPTRAFLGYYHMAMLSNFANPAWLRTFRIPPRVTLVLGTMPGSILTLAIGHHILIAQDILRTGGSYSNFTRKFSGFPRVPIETITLAETLALSPYDAGVKASRLLEQVEQRELITLCLRNQDFLEGVPAEQRQRKTQLDFQVYPPGTHCHDYTMSYNRNGGAQALDVQSRMGTYVLLGQGGQAATVQQVIEAPVDEMNELVGETTTLQAYLLNLARITPGQDITVFVFGCATTADSPAFNATYEILHRRSLNLHMTLDNLAAKVRPFLTELDGTIAPQHVLPFGCPPPQQGGGPEGIDAIYPPQPDIFDDFAYPDPPFEPIGIMPEESAEPLVPKGDEKATLESTQPLIPTESQLTVDTGLDRKPGDKRFRSLSEFETPSGTESGESSPGGTPLRSQPKKPVIETPAKPTFGGRRLPSAPTRKARRSSSSSGKRYTRRRRGLRF